MEDENTGTTPAAPTGVEAITDTGDETTTRHAETTRALLDRLRRAYADAEPALDVALLTGDTLEDLEASHAAALALIARARATVERGPVATAVPAGAPPRLAAPPATAFEKIRSGLAGLAR